MDDSVLEKYVSSFLASQPDGPVVFLWQGGEPTMRGIDFFHKAVEYAHKYKRPSQEVFHSLQTNGTLITRKWAQFFKENNFLVGVSLDGPKDLHDGYRVNKAGRGTFELVERGWHILREHEVDVNILCTVHAKNQHDPERVYTYFRDTLGARYMQFIPIVERVAAQDIARAEQGWTATQLLYQQSGDAVTSRSVDPHAYGQFLIKIFSLWKESDVGSVFVQDFDSALTSLFSAPTVCVHAPECGLNFAMEFNGDVYACDHWVEPDYRVGNIADSSFEQLAATEVMDRFSLKKKAELTRQCLSCPVRSFCNGGCPKDRFVKSYDGQDGHNYLCAGYYAFYSSIKSDLLAMARQIHAGI